MRIDRLVRAALVVATAGLAACGTEADKAYDWSGTWRGSASLTGVTADSPTPVTQQGTAEIVVTQAGTRLTGTWAIAFPLGAMGGSAAGTASDTAITLALTSIAPVACAMTAQGTRSGQTLTGTLRPDVCPSIISGSFSLTKQ